MSATERGGPLSVTYKRASELASSEAQASSTLGSNAVLVDPETQAHVRVEQQVSDSTTANVGVLVAVAIGELNQDHAKNRRDLQSSDGIRGTTSDVEEHVKQSKVNSELRP